MTARIANLVLKFTAVAGLAAGLALGSGGIEAQDTGSGNFFELHPGPLNGQTGIDPYDPYAPVDLGPAGGGSLRLVVGALDGAAVESDAAVDPCSPQRCKAW